MWSGAHRAAPGQSLGRVCLKLPRGESCEYLRSQAGEDTTVEAILLKWPRSHLQQMSSEPVTGTVRRHGQIQINKGSALGTR